MTKKQKAILGLRILVMGLPGVLFVAFGWLADKLEGLTYWLGEKLPPCNGL